MKNKRWALLVALVATIGPLLSQAQAEDGVWVARITVDGRTSIDIVDATESGCLAQVAEYREAVVVEPCQVVQAAAITDPNDANKSTRVRPRR